MIGATLPKITGFLVNFSEISMHACSSSNFFKFFREILTALVKILPMVYNWRWGPLANVLKYSQMPPKVIPARLFTVSTENVLIKRRTDGLTDCNEVLWRNSRFYFSNFEKPCEKVIEEIVHGIIHWSISKNLPSVW